MFRKILVPMDGSKLAEQVLPHVAELAGAFDSEVIMMGVCEPEENQHRDNCETNLDNQADQLKNDLGATKAARVSRMVMIGKPAREIIEYSEKNDIDLIVMSSHGRSGIAHWSLGSTVDKVVRRVGVPLLVIRATEAPTDKGKVGLFNRVLTPLDRSERGKAVLPYVTELVNKLGSEVVLMQVVATGKHVHTIGGLDYVRFEDHDINYMKSHAEEYLKNVGIELAVTKDMGYEVREGSPAQEIVKYATETNCHLIALSTHGHSFIDRWIYGSTTSKLLQISNQSLLLVPSSDMGT